MKHLLIATVALYGAAYLLVLAGHLSTSAALRRVSAVLFCVGLASHTAGLLVRIIDTGHAPMATMYETLAFYSWCTAVVTGVVMRRYGERSVELFTMPVAMLALVFGVMNAKPGGPLSLILRTIWFEIHVTASFAAYALFTLAFSGAVIYLYMTFTGSGERELLKYQDIAARSVLWGFFLFSASMFSGAVWGYLAWGAYWMWEPKVIWSFIVWFYYAGAMHAYYVKAWRGRGLAVATALGIVVVMFTYLGVSLLMKSSHSFSM